MNCKKCGRETFLPFKCPYCGEHFCSEHRLPENHDCPRIEEARTPKEGVQTEPFQQRGYKYTVSYSPVQSRMRSSVKELEHLSIGALLVAGVGLSSGIVLFENDYAMLTLVAVMLTASFFAHEIAHKITAQRQGFWAEFRLTLMGAIVTLISIISPFFKIISPGAVIVQGYTDAKKMGKTSIAGPATNIVLSAVFLPLAFLFPSYSLIFTLGSAYNAWIALFNLIPFGMLDGFKIFKWDRGIWTLGFVSSLALTVATYWLLLY